MLKFKNASLDEDKRLTSIQYELEHVTPGRDGTHLTLPLKIDVGFGKAWAQLLECRPDVPAEDPEQAMDKLAEWLERAAEAIRKRGRPNSTINIYSE